MRHKRPQSGFSLVELIVTMVIAGIFIAVISQMNSFVVNVATDAHRFEMASNLAYNNLRLYANGEPPRWFVCNGDDVGDTTASSPFTDSFKHPDATGQVLINSTSSATLNDLPPPVIQSVTATAPYGCGNTIAGMPVRIVSTVTYGASARKVIHATYVGY